MRRLILVTMLSLALISAASQQYPDASQFVVYQSESAPTSFASVEEDNLYWFRDSQFLRRTEKTWHFNNDANKGDYWDITYDTDATEWPVMRVFGEPATVENRDLGVTMSFTVGEIKVFPAPDSPLLLNTLDDTVSKTDLMQASEFVGWTSMTFDITNSLLIPQHTSLIAIEIVSTEDGGCYPNDHGLDVVLKGYPFLPHLYDDPYRMVGYFGKYKALPVHPSSLCGVQNAWLFVFAPTTDVNIEDLYVYSNYYSPDREKYVWTSEKNVLASKENEGDIPGLTKGVSQIYKPVEDIEETICPESSEEDMVCMTVVSTEAWECGEDPFPCEITYCSSTTECEIKVTKVVQFPAMAVVEPIYSGYGGAGDLNFVSVCNREAIKFGGADCDAWVGDIAAGETVLILATNYGLTCRVVGMSMQGWPVDGWVECSRLGPVPGE